MKVMNLELPDKLSDELSLLVESGWFRSEEEAVRLALVEFLARYRVELLERFQHDDIVWALQQKELRGS